MSKTTWADIAKGDAVELGGKTYVVTKAKAKGKKVAVRIERNGSTFEQEVKAKDTVARAKAEVVGKKKAEPLHDRDGRQQRWAKKSEAKEVGGALPKGNAAVTEPPAKKYGDPWETPRDRVERKLEQVLGAVLVAEAEDEAVGYYVPPVDVTTIAAHLAMFHAKDAEETAALTSLGIDDMIEHHETAHAAALNGAPLAMNHWHTKTRPRVASS